MLKGRRVYPDEAGDWHLWQSGDYGRGLDGNWYGVAPCNGDMVANLTNHTVTEHEDGTVTVAPSILVWHKDARWHGYLERGEWREC